MRSARRDPVRDCAYVDTVRRVAERTVNARQLDVLQWIIAGRPQGVMADTSYKATAIALQGRRLVKVTKKRGAWKAQATEAGQYFAEHGAYPIGHWTTTSGTTRAQTMPPLANAPAPANRSAPASEERKVTARRPVDQLITDIVTAGESLNVDDYDGHYDNLLSSAMRHGKVPDGKLLKVDHGSWPKRTLRLVDRPAWMTATLDPNRGGRPVRQAARRSPRPYAPIRSTGCGSRPAFDNEPCACSTQSRRTHPREVGRSRAHGTIATGQIGSPTWSCRSADTPTACGSRSRPTRFHTRRPQRNAATSTVGLPHNPTYDEVPSGQLTITIDSGVPVRQATFRDTKTIDLAARLPVLLQEIELRAGEAEERRI